MSERILRFGRFALDRENFELLRDGKAVKMERSPLELLLALAERAGRLVTQEEATELVWGKETHIEAGAALYTAVRKIRRALQDSSKKPRYVETVARKGYRFIAPCERPARKAEPKEEKRPVLAVLPLENFSKRADQEYFSDGLTEELITELGRVSSEEIGIIARTSVMRYKRTQKDVKEIGEELNADYLIEGSVRRERNKVRIAVQLIRIRDRSHVWAAAFEKPMREVFRAQTEVAQAVTHEIRARLSSSPPRTLEVDPEAYDEYLRGRFFQAKTVAPALRRAIGHYQRAVKVQPEFAAGWVGLAECYARLPITGDVRPKEAFPKARDAAERAIAAEPWSGEGYASRGAVRFWYMWEWEEADADTALAIERNPSSAMAYLWRAHLLSNLGKHKEALETIARAKQLDPYSRIISTLHGEFYYHAGETNYAQAEALLRYAAQVDPRFWVMQLHFGKIWGMQGKYEKAMEAARKAYEYSHGNTECLALLGWTLAKAGRDAAARRELRRLEELAKKRFVPPVHRALVRMGLGEDGEALRALEEGLEERDVRLTFLLVEPRWNVLRGERRFQKIMERLRLATK
jgi:TolB-like protein/Tfp pilus assembly protein PilF